MQKKEYRHQSHLPRKEPETWLFSKTHSRSHSYGTDPPPTSVSLLPPRPLCASEMAAKKYSPSHPCCLPGSCPVTLLGPFPSQAEPHSAVFKKPLSAGRCLQPVPTGSEGQSQVGIVLGALGLILGAP